MRIVPFRRQLPPGFQAPLFDRGMFGRRTIWEWDIICSKSWMISLKDANDELGQDAVRHSVRGRRHRREEIQGRGPMSMEGKDGEKKPSVDLHQGRAEVPR